MLKRSERLRLEVSQINKHGIAKEIQLKRF